MLPERPPVSLFVFAGAKPCTIPISFIIHPEHRLVPGGGCVCCVLRWCVLHVPIRQNCFWCAPSHLQSHFSAGWCEEGLQQLLPHAMEQQLKRLAAPASSPIHAQFAAVGLLHLLEQQPGGLLDVERARPFLEPCLTHGNKVIMVVCTCVRACKQTCVRVRASVCCSSNTPHHAHNHIYMG